MERFRDFAVMLTSQRRADNGENRKAIDRDERHPFDHNGLTMIQDQLWEQVKDRNPQSINGVEQYAEEDKYLEYPALVNKVYESPASSPKKWCEQVYRDKNSHPQAADAMQDIGQKRTLSFVSQSRHQAYIPFQAHWNLLNEKFFCHKRLFYPVMIEMLHAGTVYILRFIQTSAFPQKQSFLSFEFRL